jgi:hypothetical protein
MYEVTSVLMDFILLKSLSLTFPLPPFLPSLSLFLLSLSLQPSLFLFLSPLHLSYHHIPEDGNRRKQQTDTLRCGRRMERVLADIEYIFSVHCFITQKAEFKNFPAYPMTILFCLIKGVLKPLPECQTFTVLQ